eukprot:jgi/Mesvir1/25950/Mv25944-RA.1
MQGLKAALGGMEGRGRKPLQGLERGGAADPSQERAISDFGAGAAGSVGGRQRQLDGNPVVGNDNEAWKLAELGELENCHENCIGHGHPSQGAGLSSPETCGHGMPHEGGGGLAAGGRVRGGWGWGPSHLLALWEEAALSATPAVKAALQTAILLDKLSKAQPTTRK